MEFLKLPSEIRNMIYSSLLIAPEPIIPVGTLDLSALGGLSPADHPTLKLSTSTAPHLCVALLRTCKTVHSEATPILYSRNSFRPYLKSAWRDIFQKRHFEALEAVVEIFIKNIGWRNAAFLRRVYIPFPDLKDSRVELRKQSDRLLEVMRERCTGLKTLGLYLHGGSLETCFDGKVVDDAFSQLKERLEAVVGLEKVVVEVDHDIIRYDQFVRNVVECGWEMEHRSLREDGSSDGEEDSETESDSSAIEDDSTEGDSLDDDWTEDDSAEDYVI
jgi:hypothetical protein